ncbi:hypothetical protein [Amycolatopsis regifaucium]|uniref:hypothetical protein n=1 Tax=Amycolatopsis regifaucium TaxID=546365 RepID=UPI001FC9041A|nr:hypothetical protein [Amycolatopsis regifaucium]
MLAVELSPAATSARAARTRSAQGHQPATIVASHLVGENGEHRDRLIREFAERHKAEGGLPTDRLLDATGRF